MKLFAYLISITVCGLYAGHAQADSPWRAQTELNLPGWLSIDGAVRTRYETLDSQFRLGRRGGDQALVLRSLLKVGLHQGPFTIAAEMLDARAYLDDRGTPLNTGIVNPAELLQAYLRWDAADLLAPGAQSQLRVGRMTIDAGSRRLVARNRFRNTINAFTGVEWLWTSQSGRKLQAFFTLPVNRKPNNVAALRDNEVEFDDESSAIKFWGIYLSDRFANNDHWEVFYVGLDEDDSNHRPTRNRELSTIGLRLYRTPQVSQFDYQVESALQFGESRTSTLSANVRDLDHFAHFQHAEIGYTFPYLWRPRMIVQYDYASGDGDPNDGDNGRFDTLFGARRFDFGPTGIYGPFARSNVHTPGLRVQLKPAARITSFVAWRAYWLASDRDTWTTARLRDPSGNSGAFIGHQIEMRVRWNVVPKNVRLEGGVAHIFSGEFRDDVPLNNGQGDSTYLYTQVSLTF